MSLLELISEPRADAPVGNTDFDLHAHLAGLAGMIEEQNGQSFYRNLQQEGETLNRSLNVKELWRSGKMLPDSENTDKIKRLKKFFARLCAADGKINRHLQAMSEQYPVLSALSKGKTKDGECRMIDDEKGRRCLICLNEGAFADERLLPMLIAHELGHYIDSIGRPTDFRAHLAENEEHTADILGAETALNAGYKTTAFSRELKSKNNVFAGARQGRWISSADLSKADF